MRINRKCKNRILTAVLLSLLCLLTACGETAAEESAPVSLQIWYAADAPLCDGLRELVTEYNSQNPDTQVELCGFSDIDALKDTLLHNEPDMILCDQAEAEEYLAEQASDTALTGQFTGQYADKITGLSTRTGSSWFPVGCTTPVLVFNTDAAGRAFSEYQIGDLSSFESLCALSSQYYGADGAMFLNIGSWTGTFQALLGQMNSSLTGDRMKDAADENYVYIYNLLAETAYSSGISTVYDPEEFLAGGGIVLLTNSDTLVGIETGNAGIMSFPKTDNAMRNVLAVVPYGLAVTTQDAERQGRCAAFLTWLNAENRAGTLALENGMVPAVTGDYAGQNNLERILMTAYESGQYLTARRDLPDFDAECAAAFAVFDR